MKRILSLSAILLLPVIVTAQGNPPAVTNAGMSMEECKKNEPKMRQIGNRCLTYKKFEDRKACLDKNSSQFPKGFWEQCKMVADPVKAEFAGKEKSKYPNQQLAFADNQPMPGPGANQGMPPGQSPSQGQPGMGQQFTESECKRHEPKIRQIGNSCLPLKTTEARKACLDKNSKKVPDNVWESCRAMIEPIKSEFISKEKAKYPKQASAFEGGSHQQQAGQPGPGGPNNGGEKPQWSPEQCKKHEPTLRKLADACIAVANFDARKACFEKVGDTPSIPKDWWESCRSTIEPIKAEFMAKEKAKYPTQASALDSASNNHGNNNQNGHAQNNHGPNSGGMPPMSMEHCKKQEPQLRKSAESCLGKKSFDDRKMCFDKVRGEFPNEFWDNCNAITEPIKMEMMAKEKSKYPDQGSALN